MIRSALLALALALSAGATSASPERVDLAEAGAAIPFSLKAERIEVRALFNGKAWRVAVVDTGSDMVVISTKLARALGYDLDSAPRMWIGASSGRMRVPVVLLASVKVGEAEAQDVRAVVIDFPGRGEASAALGMNYLSRFILEVDAGAGVMTLTGR